MKTYIIVPNTYPNCFFSIQYCLGERVFDTKESAKEYLHNTKEVTEFLKSYLKIREVPINEVSSLYTRSHPHQLFQTGSLVQIVCSLEDNCYINDLLLSGDRVSEQVRKVLSQELKSTPIESTYLGTRTYKVIEYIPFTGYLLSQNPKIVPTMRILPLETLT